MPCGMFVELLRDDLRDKLADENTPLFFGCVGIDVDGV